MDYKKNICDHITYLRKKNGLSRSAMCKLIHTTPQTLDKMEQGIFPKYFRLNLLYRTGAAFQMDPYDLMRPLEKDE